jgi:hypothetical protein
LKKDVEFDQRELCKKYGVPYCPSPNELKLGIALNVRDKIVPINGLRHLPVLLPIYPGGNHEEMS